MENKYRIRIEDQLIELNSKEEYAELKNQYTNYKFMVDTQTLEITGIKTKKQPHTPKPPQWFMYWSDNVFVPFVKEVKEEFKKVNARIDRVEERLERHELELSKINATLERHELELSKINATLERHELELSKINATLERHELELSKINGVLEHNNLS